MELSELFSRGSKRSDVPDHFHGMRLREWKLKQVSSQAEEYRKTLEDTVPALNRKRIWSPPDSYGMKSI